MTPPNDFATRLEGLMERATEHGRRGDTCEFSDFILDHAPAIAEVVRAAEQAQKALDNHYYSQGRKGAVKNTDIIDAEKSIRAALAALNAEDKT